MHGFVAVVLIPTAAALHAQRKEREKRIRHGDMYVETESINRKTAMNVNANTCLWMEQRHQVRELVIDCINSMNDGVVCTCWRLAGRTTKCRFRRLWGKWCLKSEVQPKL